MSASIRPTLRPLRAIASARLTVTVDLPTPPLPEAMASTLVSELGRANGISLVGLAAAQILLELLALLVRHHPEGDVDAAHAVDAGDRRRGVAGQGVLHRASGDGEQDRHGDLPGGIDVDGLDHPELGDRTADLRVVDGGQGSLDRVQQRGGHASRLRGARRGLVVV